MSASTAESRARQLGLDIPETLAPAANYDLLTSHGGLLYVSGQLPRVGDQVAVTGRVGSDIPLAQARHAAQLCALRALGVLRQALGSLDLVERILKLQVFVQCTPEFDQHSEVADAATDLLIQVFGALGKPARTAVGVYQLPKGASVELDLIAVGPAGLRFREFHHAASR
ncbi:RidA family protein [Pigmentiphaga sp. H8]|uniref:RidA family protein n=1 Tax=Pigmentiphaga sp. H8 TaxID=2488560 RepID=UPI000F59E5BF|nr:RidA family protein [Pigmentiphaga sp. H8]AZG10746.1 RidA family protein [Pigmentiphaga sp. H8]